jgi:hypothetical protein
MRGGKCQSFKHFLFGDVASQFLKFVDSYPIRFGKVKSKAIPVTGREGP